MKEKGSKEWFLYIVYIAKDFEEESNIIVVQQFGVWTSLFREFIIYLDSRIPECHLNKLQRVAAGASQVFKDSRFCHNTPLLRVTALAACKISYSI